jgi:hypothetical protein
MSRVLAVLMLAAGVAGGADVANAGHFPREATYADHAGYYGARYRHHDRYLPDEYEPYYDHRRPRYRRYHDGYYPPVPPYYDDHYPGYYDYYDDDRILRGEDPGNVRERDRGFDPRRPHLGDGTDAPSEQYYPIRPRSCGEFFYWDGRACVDARKYPPYVGPKF